MKIRSMTATFGKLENETLTLQPGLNVISAPNEWGKSTWCAFLTVMLYGLDTRAKTTKTALADKERYAPWSGAPMSGRLEITWQGRNITIERRAKGRTPMGEFSAYETDTGLPVTRLTATTCGQVLLGVERSVFQRSGFIPLSDLPVTQDDALRRRLNALVTTGDESGAGENLAQKLKDLKNKCRFNRTGLLPQAEAQRDELESKLQELQYLQNQERSMIARQAELERTSHLLENHLVALEYAESQALQEKLSQAEQAQAEAARKTEQLRTLCDSIPSQSEIRFLREQANVLENKQVALDTRQRLLPPLPQAPEHAGPAVSPTEAQADTARYLALEASKKKNGWILGGFAALAVVLLALLLMPQVRPFALLIGLAVLLLGIGALALCALRTRRLRDQIDTLFNKYPGIPAKDWVLLAQQQEQARKHYEAELSRITTLQAQFDQDREALDRELQSFAQGRSLEAILADCSRAAATHEEFADAKQALAHAQAHLEALQALAKPAKAPELPDEMTLSEPQTRQKLSEFSFEQRQLHMRLGQCQGKMETLGSAKALQSQLDSVNARVQSLNLTYKALELALHTLADASAQLQRRFAPRISQQAQAIFSQLTGGRYSRVTLSEDLSVSTGAGTENTLRPALWRSEGTVDQLYLSLRLAVARELTPTAPLILDDAFARFDDTRLEKAMEVLAEEAKTRQVILFTCQKREEDYVN